MRALRNDVLIGGHGRILAGTREGDLPEGVHIGNPKAWIEVDDASGITPPPHSASKARWLEYATAAGLAEYLEDSPTKAQIIGVLVDAGVPVE